MYCTLIVLSRQAYPGIDHQANPRIEAIHALHLPFRFEPLAPDYRPSMSGVNWR